MNGSRGKTLADFRLEEIEEHKRNTRNSIRIFLDNNLETPEDGILFFGNDWNSAVEQFIKKNHPEAVLDCVNIPSPEGGEKTYNTTGGYIFEAHLTTVKAVDEDGLETLGIHTLTVEV